jgi:hypothetical protein
VAQQRSSRVEVATINIGEESSAWLVENASNRTTADLTFASSTADAVGPNLQASVPSLIPFVINFQFSE